MFESMLMQVVNASVPVVVATNTTTASFQALILAVASIMGTVGAILHTLSQRGELKNHKAALQSASDFISDISTHVIQSKEDIKTLADVTYQMLPEEAAKIVNAQNVRIVELTKKLQLAQEQISKIPGVLAHV
jgi:hypothetical protein